MRVDTQRHTQKIPKLRRHVSGCGRVTIAGTDYYLGAWNDAKKPAPPEVVEAYNRVIVEHLGGTKYTIQTSTPTVAMLCVAFMSHAAEHYLRVDGSSTSELANFRQSMKPLLELYGRTLVKNFGPKSLKAVRQKMIENKLARTVINQRIRRLKHVFKWGASEELVPGDVWHQISAVPGLQKGRTAAHETDPIQPVSMEDFERVVSECRPTVAAMARLQLLTGMRPGEVCRMTPGQVDRTGPIWIYRPHQHKTSWRGKVREIAIGPRGQDLLRPFLLRGKEDPCFTRARRGNGKRTSSSKPYAPSDYGLYLRRVAKRIGVTPWAPNQLRHTRATEVRNKFGLEFARVILGHSTPVVTEIYAEQDRMAAFKIMGEIG